MKVCTDATKKPILDLEVPKLSEFCTAPLFISTQKYSGDSEILILWLGTKRWSRALYHSTILIIAKPSPSSLVTRVADTKVIGALRGTVDAIPLDKKIRKKNARHYY